MVVGLPPLEFTECVSDSPNFRENLHKHEKELDNTSQQIKRLIKEVKDLLTAAKSRFFFREFKRFYFLEFTKVPLPSWCLKYPRRKPKYRLNKNVFVNLEGKLLNSNLK